MGRARSSADRRIVARDPRARALAGRAPQVMGAFVPEWLEARLLMAFSANVNFQPAAAPVPAGYVADSGKVFGSRGNGFTYGWNLANPNNVDRNSSRSPDQ